MVAFGGGHGLAASLRALRRITDDLTAVVTVADDGGSSGRIREELGALPPGDLRMALVALAGEDVWSRLFQHRFPGGGSLGGHAAGNVVLTALYDVSGSHQAALDLAGALLQARGRVMPMTTADVEIVAEVGGLDPSDPGALKQVRGQVEVATTPGRVCAVWLEPADPPAAPEAISAIKQADWVVLGPGSLFTSVIPHLLVSELREAVEQSAARRCLVLNLMPQTGETTGFSAAAHLDAIAAHAAELRLDVVIADSGVLDRDGLMEAAAGFGATVHFADVAAEPARHDPERLARAYAEIMSPSGGSGIPWR